MTFSLTFKGFNYVADVYGSYTGGDSLPALAGIGANAAAITVDYGIDVSTSSVYVDDVPGGYSESDADVATTIGNATGAGLGVMVRPLIDFLPTNYDSPQAGQANPLNGAYSAGEYRTYYNPTNVANFFSSYQTLIVDEATVAQQNGASLFCIGTELDQLTGAAYKPYWESIISAVRGVFSGKLTYSAEWNDSTSPWQYGGTGLPLGTGNLATQVSFWADLDYVGIDCYAPISDAANPSVADLVQGWTQVPTTAASLAVTGDNESLIDYFNSVSAATGKKIIFTELGYANASDAASSPATPGYDEDGNADGATTDPTLQANLYTAFFDAWEQSGSAAVVGMYGWNWEPNAPGGFNFSPQGLPAQSAVQTGFTACYAAGTRIATPAGEILVETLRAGDTVSTASGVARQIVWVGQRRVNCASHPQPARIWPVRVAAHAFAEAQPRRDLFLSPDHAVYVDGVLIPIRCLINDATVAQEKVAEITYRHVELSTHDVLLAEGLPAESYLDTGNRTSFANGSVTSLQPRFERDAATAWAREACAPLAEDGPLVHVVRARLDARAEALGWRLPRTQTVLLDQVGRTSAVVAEAIERVRLVSSARCEAPDLRRLGALIVGLEVDGVRLTLDDARLTRGVHEIETHDGVYVRWTDGAAILVLGPGAGPRTLSVEVVAVKDNAHEAPPARSRGFVRA